MFPLQLGAEKELIIGRTDEKLLNNPLFCETPGYGRGNNVAFVTRRP